MSKPLFVLAGIVFLGLWLFFSLGLIYEGIGIRVLSWYGYGHATFDGFAVFGMLVQVGVGILIFHGGYRGTSFVLKERFA